MLSPHYDFSVLPYPNAFIKTEDDTLSKLRSWPTEMERDTTRVFYGFASVLSMASSASPVQVRPCCVQHGSVGVQETWYSDLCKTPWKMFWTLRTLCSWWQSGVLYFLNGKYWRCGIVVAFFLLFYLMINACSVCFFLFFFLLLFEKGEGWETNQTQKCKFTQLGLTFQLIYH